MQSMYVFYSPSQLGQHHLENLPKGMDVKRKSEESILSAFFDDDTASSIFQ